MKTGILLTSGNLALDKLSDKKKCCLEQGSIFFIGRVFYLPA